MDRKLSSTALRKVGTAARLETTWLLPVGAVAMCTAVVGCSVYDENLLLDGPRNETLAVADPRGTGGDPVPTVTPTSTPGAPGGAPAASAVPNAIGSSPMGDPTLDVDGGESAPAPSSSGVGGASGLGGAPDSVVSTGDAGSPVEDERGGAAGLGLTDDAVTDLDAGFSDSEGTVDSGAEGGPEGGEPVLTTSPEVWGFDDDIRGWVIGVSDPTTLAGQARLSFSGTEGSPMVGSLMLEVPFFGTDQRIAVQSQMPSADLRGLTLRAQVYLASGMSEDPANPSQIKLFAKSGDTYLFASGAPINLPPDAGWASVSFEVDNPDYVDPSGNFDAADVREVGFELNTGPSSVVINSAVIYLDSVDY